MPAEAPEYSITLTREVNAAAKQVYAAWTEQATMERWSSKVCADIRVGGRYRFQRSAEGDKRTSIPESMSRLKTSGAPNESEKMSLVGTSVPSVGTRGSSRWYTHSYPLTRGRRMRAMATGGLTFLLLSNAAAGQRSPAPTVACSYATCSLRLENAKLIRGHDEVLGRTTLRGMPRLAPVVAHVDSARAYAHVFDREHSRSRWLALAAGAMLGLGAGIALDGADAPSRGVGLSLAGAGVALAGFGWRSNARATQALSRTLWWYNGSLPRGPGDARP